ncbi:WD40 repeat domain-containing protein [bacterium]|nr:WD40 repeat domain-containing protein [bacterium]
MKTQNRSYALSFLHGDLPLVARTVSPQEVVLLDWAEQAEKGRFRGKVGTVTALSLHPQGQLVAVAGEQDRVEVWNAAESRQVAAFDGKVSGLRFSPDGRLLLLGQPGRLVAWDWEAGQNAWSLEEKSFQNPALLDCHGPQLLWTAMGAGNLLVVDLQAGQVVHRWDTRDEFMAVAFHPDGKRVAAAINTVRSPLLHQFVMLRVGEDLPTREFPIPFMSVSVAVSPGGGTVATGDARGVQLWDFASGAPEGRLAPRAETKVKDFGTVEVASAFLVATLRFADAGKGLVSDGDVFCHWELSEKKATFQYPS